MLLIPEFNLPAPTVLVLTGYEQRFVGLGTSFFLAEPRTMAGLAIDAVEG